MEQVSRVNIINKTSFVSLIDSLLETQNAVYAYDCLSYLYNNYEHIPSHELVELEFIQLPTFPYSVMSFDGLDLDFGTACSYLLEVLIRLLHKTNEVTPEDADIIQDFHKRQLDKRIRSVLFIANGHEPLLKLARSMEDTPTIVESVDGEKHEMNEEEADLFASLSLESRCIEPIEPADSIDVLLLQQLIDFSSHTVLSYIVDEDDRAIFRPEVILALPGLFRKKNFFIIQLGQVGKLDTIFNRVEGNPDFKNRFGLGIESLDTILDRISNLIRSQLPKEEQPE